MGGRQTLFRSLKDIGKSTSPTRFTPYVPPSFAASPMAPPPTGPVLEGVFAINKPPAISSAQVIREVQQHFNPSQLFAPWLYREQKRKDNESHNQKQKRRSWKSRQPLQVKMGHGGTLDPMATGVLILGVGTGTKSLNSFLECTKSYDCVLLFGAATDSYDTEGKVAVRKPYEHITREKVEEALQQFRGPIQQRPPIFSALKVNGKKLYEYAREGKQPPIEIAERPVTVEELELVEWYEGGTHDWNWPEKEAEQQDKEALKKASHLDTKDESDGAKPAKREREDDNDETVGGAVKSSDGPDAKRAKTEDEPVVSGALPAEASIDDKSQVATSIEPADANAKPAVQSARCSAPAVRLSMTVTSGFYVRSLCHDLAIALGSAGCMASLSRTRQGDFALGTDTVLMYEDLGKGEEVWGPKIEILLQRWQQKGKEDIVGKAGSSTATKGDAEEAAVEDEEVDGYEAAEGRQAGAGPRARRNTSSDED